MNFDESSFDIYRATVLRVIDSDTVEIEIDLGFYGFYIYWRTRVRLLSSHGGVDTPELHSVKPIERALAKTAMARTEELLPFGAEVLIKTQLDKKDSFGRVLAQIINMNGENVGDALNGQFLSPSARATMANCASVTQTTKGAAIGCGRC